MRIAKEPLVGQLLAGLTGPLMSAALRQHLRPISAVNDCDLGRDRQGGSGVSAPIRCATNDSLIIGVFGRPQQLECCAAPNAGVAEARARSIAATDGRRIPPRPFQARADRRRARDRARGRGRGRLDRRKRRASTGKACACRCRAAQLPPSRRARRAASPTVSRCRLRHHNEALHAAACPPSRARALATTRSSSVRYEAIGENELRRDARQSRLRDSTCATRSDPIARADSADEVPMPDRALADAARGADRPADPRSRPRGRGDGARISIESRIGDDFERLADAARRPERVPAALARHAAPSRPGPAPRNSRRPATKRRRRRGRSRRGRGTRATGPGRRRPRRAEQIRRTARAKARARKRRRSRQTRRWARATSATRARKAMMPVRPNRPWTDLPEDFDYKVFTTEFDEVDRGARTVRFRGTGPAARLSRQPAHRAAGRGHPARQPAAAAADGAAEPQLGFRPGRGAARCRAARRGWSSPRPFAELQGRAGQRVQGHGRDPADRQFRLDARAADLDRRDQRRHPRPHAGALRGQGRDPRLHHPRVEGRAEPREMARRGQAGAARAGSTTCGTSSTSRRTSPCAARARTSA